MADQTPNLTKETLFETGTNGIHVVDEPIIGYKKIFCDCDMDSIHPIRYLPAIAELLIHSVLPLSNHVGVINIEQIKPW
jgi:hypothetical protein